MTDMNSMDWTINQEKCSTNKALVEFVLKYKGITTEILKDGIEFSYFTSMHNDFEDGMEDLLKEIIMYFCFDTNYKVEFKREDDEGKNPKDDKMEKINIISTPENVGSLAKKFMRKLKK